VRRQPGRWCVQSGAAEPQRGVEPVFVQESLFQSGRGGAEPPRGQNVGGFVPVFCGASAMRLANPRASGPQNRLAPRHLRLSLRHDRPLHHPGTPKTVWIVIMSGPKFIAAILCAGVLGGGWAPIWPAKARWISCGAKRGLQKQLQQAQADRQAALAKAAGNKRKWKTCARIRWPWRCCANN
jgi:hypothetical protein